MTPATARIDAFPIGAAATLEELEADPHAFLARLCEHEPVSWLPIPREAPVTSAFFPSSEQKEAELNATMLPALAPGSRAC